MTDGGASSGYRAIGSVGIDTAPARMISSEQTVDRTGRRIKTSASIIGSPLPTRQEQPAAGARRCRHAPAHRRESSAGRTTISCSPACSPLCTHIVVADDLAELHRLLLGDHARPSAFSATNAKYCALMRITAVTGTVSPGVVLQTTARAHELIGAELRRRLDSGALASTDCVAVSTFGEMNVISLVAITLP